MGFFSLILIPIGLIVGGILIYKKKGKLWLNILVMASGFILLILAIGIYTVTSVVTNLNSGNIAGSFIQQ